MDRYSFISGLVVGAILTAVAYSVASRVATSSRLSSPIEAALRVPTGGRPQFQSGSEASVAYEASQTTERRDDKPAGGLSSNPAAGTESAALEQRLWTVLSNAGLALISIESVECVKAVCNVEFVPVHQESKTVDEFMDIDQRMAEAGILATNFSITSTVKKEGYRSIRLRMTVVGTGSPKKSSR